VDENGKDLFNQEYSEAAADRIWNMFWKNIEGEAFASSFFCLIKLH
jgi:hypothetical protein